MMPSIPSLHIFVIMALLLLVSAEGSSSSLSSWQQGGALLDYSMPPPRGGSTTAASRPVMDLHHVSLSLRYTCEVNRRLQQASRLEPSIHDHVVSTDANNHFLSPRGGQVQIHPSQCWQRPILAKAPSTTESLTIFHAKSPRPAKAGTLRWGPDLEHFLAYLMEAWNVENVDLVLALAMVYLDRASSVETPRSVPPCPYLVPRTVHRLVLTALGLAVQAVSSRKLWNHEIRGLGLTEQEFGYLQEWMREALGPQGSHVSTDELQGLLARWNKTWKKQ